MAWAAGTLHHLFEGAEVVDGFDLFGVHLLDRRHKGDVGTGGCKLLEVGIHGAGIFGKILLVVELYGVDEHAHHDDVVFFSGTVHERKMAFVEGSHGGYQTNGFVFFLGLFYGCGKCSDGGVSIHGCLLFVFVGVLVGHILVGAETVFIGIGVRVDGLAVGGLVFGAAAEAVGQF